MTNTTTARVRAWARSQGYTVADRGRLPAQVLAAYAAAHAEEELPPGDGPPVVPLDDRSGPSPAEVEDEPGVGPQHDAPLPSTPAAANDTSPDLGVPPLSTRTDGPSRAALLTGVLPPLAPVGVVLGVVGLVRTRRSGRPGRRLALAGLAAGTAWLVVLGSFVASYDPTRPPERVGQGAGVRVAADVLLEDLEPGDCVQRLPSGPVRDLRAVPCARAHRAEVYAVFDVTPLPGGGYPGDEQVRSLADGGCDQRSASLGLPTDGLRPFSFSPDAQTWSVGDREVLCLLQADSAVTGQLPRRGPAAPPAPGSPAPPAGPTSVPSP